MDDQLYICTQCNAEYDAPGMCEMCDVELIPESGEEPGGTGEEGNRFEEFAEEEDELGEGLSEEESSQEEPYTEMNEDEENY
jgi:hypothetical protein